MKLHRHDICVHCHLLHLTKSKDSINSTLLLLLFYITNSLQTDLPHSWRTFFPTLQITIIDYDTLLSPQTLMDYDLCIQTYLCHKITLPLFYRIPIFLNFYNIQGQSYNISYWITELSVLCSLCFIKVNPKFLKCRYVAQFSAPEDTTNGMI